MDSNLQIISGKWRGKKLHLPPDARPTQNRARIALFNILNACGEPSLSAFLRKKGGKPVVWDAFCGSGAFGLECLSRDIAGKVIFTDTDTKTIERNLQLFGTEQSGAVLSKSAPPALVKQSDAIAEIANFGSAADLVFIDPPYSAPELGFRFVRALAKVAKSGAMLVWEMENTKCNLQSAKCNNLEIVKDRIYGRARFLILRKN